LRSGAALLGFGAATALVAGLGALATQKSVNSPWYRFLLKKPSFQPPRAVFAPVWTGLYALMALSAWRVWKAPESKERTQALSLWGGQLALNGAWSAIFFGRREPGWALADIALLDGAVGAYAYKAAQVDKTAAWLVAPYIGWSSFATVLNGSIAYMNR
jgi:benzodiazapine receptor